VDCHRSGDTARAGGGVKLVVDDENLRISQTELGRNSSEAVGGRDRRGSRY